MIKNKIKQKGSSFIEIILYMAIFSMLLVILLQMFTSIIDIQLESQTRSSVLQDERFILQRLTFDIRRAQSINIPAAPGEQGSTLQLVIDGINYTYSLDGNDLTLNNNLGTDSINSSETAVSSINFTRLGEASGKNSLQALFTLTSNAKRRSGPEQEVFSATIGTR
ncbi:MAG: hypothetical protein HYT08_01685 [Candidatus Levybacteria bacterium]|nr:hypothetical protein [Candidatus Levybacteria bacterium]